MVNALPSASSNKRENNKIRQEDRPIHSWYRFVLSFPPHLVREYLHRFGTAPGARVLDPFCGTGTTLVECRKLGVASLGLEPNPWLAWPVRSRLIGKSTRMPDLPPRTSPPSKLDSEPFEVHSKG